MTFPAEIGNFVLAEAGCLQQVFAGDPLFVGLVAVPVQCFDRGCKCCLFFDGQAIQGNMLRRIGESAFQGTDERFVCLTGKACDKVKTEVPMPVFCREFQGFFCFFRPAVPVYACQGGFMQALNAERKPPPVCRACGKDGKQVS